MVKINKIHIYSLLCGKSIRKVYDGRKIVRKVEIKEKPLGNKLNKVRKKLSSLSKNGFNNQITVIALQQGIGKTYMFIEYAKKHRQKEKIIFVSPRHNHLEEIENELPRNNARHWYGFAYKDKFGTYKGCPKLNENNALLNELKKEKNKHLLNPKFVCKVLGCNKSKCPYHKIRSPNKNKIDLMPIEYLGTDMMLKQQPNIVFIDEAIDKVEEYRYDDKIVTACESIAKKYNYSQLSKDLNSLNLKFKSKHKKSAINNSLLDGIENDANALMTDLINKKDFDSANKLYELFGVLKYFKYMKYTPSYCPRFYYRPKIYDAFDLACKNGVKIVFLNASFNKELFKYFLETYPNSNNCKDMKIPVYTSDIRNDKSLLIRVYPNNNFWKKAFEPKSKAETMEKIYKVIGVMEKYIPREKIGIITHQKIDDENLEDKFKLMGYDTLHFWAESGLNILENKYVLIIIGTPFMPTKDIIKEWKKIHNRKVINLNENDIGGKDSLILDEKSGLIIKTEKGYRLGDIAIKNGDICDFEAIISKNENQMIDSIHRCRPLTHTRIVIVLGRMSREFGLNINGKMVRLWPENFDIGIKYEEANDEKELEKLIKSHEIVKQYKVERLFRYVLDNKDYMSNTEIARHFKLWKKRNPNASFIKKVKKKIKDINQTIK